MCNTRRYREGFEELSEGAGVISAVQGYPLSFTDSSNLPRSKVLTSRAGLSFSLFCLSMSNTQASGEIPLPRGVTADNVN